VDSKVHNHRRVQAKEAPDRSGQTSVDGFLGGWETYKTMGINPLSLPNASFVHLNHLHHHHGSTSYCQLSLQSRRDSVIPSLCWQEPARSRIRCTPPRSNAAPEHRQLVGSNDVLSCRGAETRHNSLWSSNLSHRQVRVRRWSRRHEVAQPFKKRVILDCEEDGWQYPRPGRMDMQSLSTQISQKQ